MSSEPHAPGCICNSAVQSTCSTWALARWWHRSCMNSSAYIPGVAAEAHVFCMGRLQNAMQRRACRRASHVAAPGGLTMRGLPGDGAQLLRLLQGVTMLCQVLQQLQGCSARCHAVLVA